MAEKGDLLHYPPAMRALAQRFIGEEVTATLRHELTGKLGAMGMFLHSLEKRIMAAGGPLENDERAKEALGMLQSTLKGALAIVDTKVASPLSEERDPVEVMEVLRELVADLDLQRVRVEDGGCDAWVDVDRPELELALACLLENALEATRNEVKVRCTREAESVAIEVSDDGAGIEKPPVGQPFFSTKPGRFGVGLRIARRIARRWGGQLGARRVGEITCVTLQWPALTTPEDRDDGD